jgi:proteasome lid subunit RPN8/RPN11
MRSALEIPADIWDAMLEHVRACLPEEACGLLAGSGDQVLTALPVENAIHSATRFRMVPEAQVEAMTHIEALGQDLVAIYHSHPNGPPGPSATDLAEAAYPEAAYLIWSQVPTWSCQGFDLSGPEPRRIRVVRQTGEESPDNR